MVWRLCQLKSLLVASLLVVSACAKLKSKDYILAPRELLSDISPHWMSINSKHALWNQEEKSEPHLFYDFSPEFSNDKTFVNVVITTPQDSPYAYKLDTKSGQRYYSHTYCNQKDVWGKRGGTFNRPNFAQGYVPRLLDQLGGPQKIIVLENNIRSTGEVDRKFLRVKIVGAYVEKTCPEGNCVNKDNWMSRLVLVAADPLDKKYQNLKTIGEIRKRSDWEDVRATLENMDGRSFITDNSYPAIKVGQLLPYSDAIDYLKENTIYVSNSEMLNIAKGCHALYDRLWKDVGENTKQHIISVKRAQPKKDLYKLKDEIKKNEQSISMGFSDQVTSFTRKYYKEIMTCDKFVYHGNINQNVETFWFLNYMMMFYRLHQEGHYYNCENKTWQRNVLNDEGLPVYDLKKEIDKCDDKSLDIAMEYMYNYLVGIKGSSAPYYRFVEYDTHIFGSHRKLYTWVKMDARKFECSSNLNEEIFKNAKIIPEEVRWKPRNVSKPDETKLIK